MAWFLANFSKLQFRKILFYICILPQIEFDHFQRFFFCEIYLNFPFSIRNSSVIKCKYIACVRYIGAVQYSGYHA